ncbi:Ff.00g130310.m01.CDS01 [Fusarium sp. VM40]|nr:Ff.00g130310.m01.CDS01 [Fusarium sp. VM40]
MSSLFCCSSIEPYRSQYLSHQSKFNNFMAWASFPKDSSPGEANMSKITPPFAVQLVRQVNFGPLESKRYFIPTDATEDNFVEITENDLIQANFQKVNTYKNYRCRGHNKFFEVNIYQNNPVNEHHWRANIARPAGSIDL